MSCKDNFFQWHRSNLDLCIFQHEGKSDNEVAQISFQLNFEFVARQLPES